MWLLSDHTKIYFKLKTLIMTTTYDGTIQSPKKDPRNLIIVLLSIALVGVSVYAFMNNSKKSDIITKHEASINQTTSERDALQKSFDASVARFDSLTTVNSGLETQLSASNSEIAKTKEQIRSILSKKNATAAELAKAKKLIDDMNGKIAGMEQEIARLTKENEGLTQDKAALTQDKANLTQELSSTTAAKEDLAKKVDVASTLHASNISITPINVKGNGKEKVTSTAKKVDKLVVAFDVENRIAQAGTTDVYVVVVAPDGKTITSEKSGSGTVSTREEGNKTFTVKVPVQFDASKKNSVNFAFVPEQSFTTGSYTIQLYQNGFKIGEAKQDLKKGGLF